MKTASEKIAALLDQATDDLARENARPLQIVDISATVQMYLPSFACLFDPSIDQVKMASQAMPDTFVFIFITKSEWVDFNDLPKSDYVLLPISLHHIKDSDRMAAALEIVNRALEI